MSVPERHAIVKVVRNITGKIDSSFATWSIGVGFEAQLSQLRGSVGLAPVSSATPKSKCLDYELLVRPSVCADTLGCNSIEKNLPLNQLEEPFEFWCKISQTVKC